MPRGAVISLSHGGGPLPVLGDPNHAAITTSLRTRVPRLLRLGTPDAPRAIVVVTAHWSTDRPTVSSGARHPLLFDYYNFPAEAYRLKYDAPGSPEVAAEVFSAFEKAGLKPKMDPERGWDHGVFIPMLLINPAADVPIVQVSVLASEDPAAHIAMGTALSSLRDGNVAVIGSGFASLHNLSLMLRGGLDAPGFKARNDEWSRAVTAAAREADPAERGRRFDGWRSWPGGWEMHPRGGGEHFMPLIVCAGAGGEGPAEFYTDEFSGLDMYSYYWA